MKKINKITLKRIDVDQSDILSKRDLRNILGGAAYWCHCGYPDTGAWTGNYSSVSSAESRGSQWCEHGVAHCAYY